VFFNQKKFKRIFFYIASSISKGLRFKHSKVDFSGRLLSPTKTDITLFRPWFGVRNEGRAARAY